jgi:hypothetical protein
MLQFILGLTCHPLADQLYPMLRMFSLIPETLEPELKIKTEPSNVLVTYSCND